MSEDTRLTWVASTFRDCHPAYQKFFLAECSEVSGAAVNNTDAPRFINEKLRALHNASIDYSNENTSSSRIHEVTLTFDTEQDKLMFLLRWA